MNDILNKLKQLRQKLELSVEFRKNNEDEEAKPLRFWIHPSGEIHDIGEYDDTESHEEWLMDNHQLSTKTAYEKGWISGNHGDEWNIAGHSKYLNNQSHPATQEARRQASMFHSDKMDIIHIDAPYEKVYNTVSTHHWAKYGTIPKPGSVAEFHKTELKKEIYELADRKYSHGWISPEGKYTRIDPSAQHNEWFGRHHGMSASDAYAQGWIGIGHGGFNNVSGHKRYISDPNHPAVVTARKLISQRPEDEVGINYTDNVSSMESLNVKAESVPKEHWVKHGTIPVKGSIAEFHKSEDKTKEQDYGYNTHGEWSSVKGLRGVERERGNEFPVPKKMDNTHEGIWVTHKPLHSVAYKFPPAYHEHFLSEKAPKKNPDKYAISSEEHQEALKAFKNPMKYTQKVDVRGAKIMHEDPDGGYLYVRPIKRLKKTELEDVTNKLHLEHYSDKKLDTIDPSMHGTGVPGEEKKYIGDVNYQPRSYHYIAGSKPELLLGSKKFKHTSSVDSSKIYDIDTDTHNLYDKAKANSPYTKGVHHPPTFERHIKDAGYHGYKSGNVVAMFVSLKPHKVEENIRKSLELRKEVWPGGQKEAHGWIDSEGKFYKIPPFEAHDQWIKTHHNVPSYDSAYKQGWLAIGVAGKHNVHGDSKYLFNANHPATKTARLLAGKHFGEETELSTEGWKSATVPTNHWVKHGTIPKPESVAEFHKSAKEPLLPNKYSIITAESPRFEAKDKGGNKALEGELKSKGYKYEPITGKYDESGKVENGFLIHHADPAHVNQLGEKYGQESVIHSESNVHKMHYTNGPKAGQHHKGEGITIHDKEPKNYYSNVIRGGKKTHFTLNFDFDKLHRSGPILDKLALLKGAMQRLAPFKPQRESDRPSESQEENIANWQGMEGGHEDYTSPRVYREAIDPMEGAVRMRALHHLHSQTQVRRAKDGGREFLLHRGMGLSEYHKKAEGRDTINHTIRSSWSPNRSSASNIVQGGAGGRVASAWIHEKHIVHIPKQLGDLSADFDSDEVFDRPTPKGPNQYSPEHEVIVEAGHNSQIHKPEVKKSDPILSNLLKLKEILKAKTEAHHTIPFAVKPGTKKKLSVDEKIRRINFHLDNMFSSGGTSTLKDITPKEHKEVHGIKAPVVKSDRDWRNDMKRHGDYYLEHYKDKDGNHSVTAYDNNFMSVGRADFVHSLIPNKEDTHLESHPTKMKAWDVHVDSNHRRKGLATAMYRYAEEKSGKKIVPGDFVTPEGKKFRGSIKKNIDLQKMSLAFDHERDKKPHTTVWRMEDKEGHGPYHHPKISSLQWSTSGSPRRSPTPEDDPGFSHSEVAHNPSEKEMTAYLQDKNKSGPMPVPVPYKGKKFGFSSPEQANKWFTPTETKKLKTLGFELKPKKAKRVWAGTHQVYYEPHEDEIKKAKPVDKNQMPLDFAIKPDSDVTEADLTNQLFNREITARERISALSHPKINENHLYQVIDHAKHGIDDVTEAALNHPKINEFHLQQFIDQQSRGSGYSSGDSYKILSKHPKLDEKHISTAIGDTNQNLNMFNALMYSPKFNASHIQETVNNGSADQQKHLLLHPTQSTKLNSEHLHSLLSTPHEKYGGHDISRLVFEHPEHNSSHVEAAMNSVDFNRRWYAMGSPMATDEQLMRGTKDTEDSVRARVMGNPMVKPEHVASILRLDKDPGRTELQDEEIMGLISSKASTPQDIETMWNHPGFQKERYAHPAAMDKLFSNPKTPEHIVDWGRNSKYQADKLAALRHPSTNEQHLMGAIQGVGPGAGIIEPHTFPYETAVEALKHPKINHEHIKVALAHPMQGVRAEAVRHPLATLEDAQGLLNDRAEAVRNAAKKKIGNENPDALYNTSVIYKPNTEIYRQYRKIVDEKGPIHKRDFQSNGITQEHVSHLLDHEGKLTSEKLSHHIDSAPSNRFNVSATTWTGGQRHNEHPSHVTQFNLTTDQVGKLKAAGAYDTFTKIQKLSHYSAHPVTDHTIGWVRSTSREQGFDTRTTHIDEIQSDFGRKLSDIARSQSKHAQAKGEITSEQASQAVVNAQNEYPDEHLKSIQNIVFGSQKPTHALHEAFHQVLRDKGRVGERMHINSPELKAEIANMSVGGEKELPVHIKETYGKQPAKMGYGLSQYGKIETQSGTQYKGKPTMATVLAKIHKLRDLMDLRKEVYGEGSQREAHGWVDPQGKYYQLHPRVTHREWLRSTHKLYEMDAYDKGWLKIGIAGRSNVTGNPKYLHDPHHPATAVARKLAGQHFMDNQTELTAVDKNRMSIDNVDTQHWSKHGTIPLKGGVAEFHKAELIKSDFPVYGWINPSGKYHKMDSSDVHYNWLKDTQGLEPEKAYKQGWISLGHGGGHNVNGHSFILQAPGHPATMTARALVGKHWGGKSVEIGFDNNNFLHTVSASHWSKHGTIPIKGGVAEFHKNDPIQNTYSFEDVQIMIEWPKGSTRKYGSDYEKEMKCDYGYISGTKGDDGEEEDAYVGDNRNSKRIFLIEQIDTKGGEDKIMFGFNSPEEAKSMYLAHMKPQNFKSIREITLNDVRGMKSLKKNEFPIDIDVNPSGKRLQQIAANGEFRAFLHGKDMIAFDPTHALHQHVREKLNLPKDVIPLHGIVDNNKVTHVYVTDNSRYSPVHENPKVYEQIKSHPHMSKLADSKMGISYYNEDIVGPWHEMKEKGFEKSILNKLEKLRKALKS